VVCQVNVHGTFLLIVAIEQQLMQRRRKSYWLPVSSTTTALLKVAVLSVPEGWECCTQPRAARTGSVGRPRSASYLLRKTRPYSLHVASGCLTL